MLEGTLSMDGHGTHSFSAGRGFAEVTNTWHNGRNPTDKPARFLIVFAGQKGTPNLGPAVDGAAHAPKFPIAEETDL